MTLLLMELTVLPWRCADYQDACTVRLENCITTEQYTYHSTQRDGRHVATGVTSSEVAHADQVSLFFYLVSFASPLTISKMYCCMVD